MRPNQRRTAAALLILLTGLAFPVPVSAHQSLAERHGSLKCLPGQTTYGDAYLDHSFELMRIQAGNPATGTCESFIPSNMAPGTLYMGGLFYHDGVTPACYGTGSVSNSGWTTRLEWVSYRDVFWDGCNRGIGVNTYITLDTWFSSVNPTTGAWQSGNWRPAVGHCHCP